MSDLTIVNPTNHTFPTGSNINVPCRIGIITAFNPEAGSGTMTTYTATSMSATGSYSYLNFSGNWTVDVSRNANGTWAVKIDLSGSLSSGSRSFNASCSQDSSDTPKLRFVDITDSSTYAILEQNNGSLTTAGKININASWVPVFTLYLYKP